MKNKKSLIIVLIIAIIAVAIAVVLGKTMTKKENNIEVANENIVNDVVENKVEEPIQEEQKGKIDIVDVDSNSRPYAVVVNNTPVAVKVQEGLNKAYMVYEIPTEGNTSRLLAFYKDAPDVTIGTIRSARHNFIDYALESDAIFCCYGWSHYAEDDLKNGSIDYLQGLTGSSAYYRNNPEGLASEHTAYTSTSKIKSTVNSRSLRTTTDKKVLLNYNVEDVDLSTLNNVQKAEKITIPYGAKPNVTSFKYDEKTKMYTRYENSNKCVDHNTKEGVTTKNIIIQKLGYEMCDDNYYWNLFTVGSGEGYFITNGNAVPITWEKESRSSKTKYMYKQGTVINGKNVGGQEIEVSDGRTWIEVQTTKQALTIE